MSQNITINISASEPLTIGGERQHVNQVSQPFPTDLQEMDQIHQGALSMEPQPTPNLFPDETGSTYTSSIDPTPGFCGEESSPILDHFSDYSHAEPSPFGSIDLGEAELGMVAPEPDMPTDSSGYNEPVPEADIGTEEDAPKMTKGKK